MRILHTADWHIGQTLAGYSRENEHRAALDQIIRIVREREVDALIVAGDVYDTQNPSGDAQRLLFETLAALHRARPSLQVVLTAGNHDAAGRLEAPAPLLAAIGVTAVGSVRRTSSLVDAARHLVVLKDETGRPAAEVLAVSYPTAACLPPWPEEDGLLSPIAAATRRLYEELMVGSAPWQQGLPLIVTGHLHVAGALESEGAERRILVGGAHAVPPDIFPAEAAYVALGHLHRPQRIGRDTIRYSGSLFPLSASELAYTHSVTLLTLDGPGTIAIEILPLTRAVPFLRLPEQGEARLDEIGDRLTALALDPDAPIEQQPFIRLALARDGLTPGFRAELDRLVANFPVRLVDVVLTPRPEALRVAQADPLVRLAELAPEDLFVQSFERTHRRQPGTAHRAAFHRAQADAEAGD